MVTQTATLTKTQECPCGITFFKMVENGVTVYRDGVHIFEIRYCPECGQELAQLSTPAFAGDPRTAENLQNLTQEEARAWFESVEPYPF